MRCGAIWRDVHELAQSGATQRAGRRCDVVRRITICDRLAVGRQEPPLGFLSEPPPRLAGGVKSMLYPST
eukprot:9789712-Lingulodinium_polyedra.AAC.1